MSDLAKRMEAAGPAHAPTCQWCKFVRTFKPRRDEQERYGFGDIGYGCTKSGWEGYTKAEGWCPSFFGNQAASLRASQGGTDV